MASGELGAAGGSSLFATRYSPFLAPIPAVLAGFQASFPWLGAFGGYKSGHPARELLAPLVFVWLSGIASRPRENRTHNDWRKSRPGSVRGRDRTRRNI